MLRKLRRARLRDLARAGVAGAALLGAAAFGAGPALAASLTAQTSWTPPRFVPGYILSIGDVVTAGYVLADGTIVVNGYSSAPATTTSASNAVTTAAGYPVTFSAKADSANPVRYAWSFGDGTYEFGAASMTHTYSQPGVYTVKVDIVNENMQDEIATMTVTVVGESGDSRFLTQGNAADRYTFVTQGYSLLPTSFGQPAVNANVFPMP